MKRKISIVIPMFNEQEVIEKCFERMIAVMESMREYEYEVIVIDDGSRDDTYRIASNIASKNEKIKVLSFSRNFGHQAAVTAGLQFSTGDAVVIIDADLQDPPELIPDMVKLWKDGYDVVYGKRKT